MIFNIPFLRDRTRFCSFFSCLAGNACSSGLGMGEVNWRKKSYHQVKSNTGIYLMSIEAKKMKTKDKGNVLSISLLIRVSLASQISHIALRASSSCLAEVAQVSAWARSSLCFWASSSRCFFSTATALYISDFWVWSHSNSFWSQSLHLFPSGVQRCAHRRASKVYSSTFPATACRSSWASCDPRAASKTPWSEYWCIPKKGKC